MIMSHHLTIGIDTGSVAVKTPLVDTNAKTVQSGKKFRAQRVNDAGLVLYSNFKISKFSRMVR
jgi:activator of 2-hydroxyglutaryl-CoA dehydratase